MATKPEKVENRKPIRFKVSYDGKPDKPISAVVYAFDAQGQFIASGAVRDGEAQLKLAAEQLKRARLFVAPALPAGRNTAPSLKLMAHFNAYEPTWRFEPRRELYEFLPVPELLWPHWFWCACRVRGTVIKAETLGGVTYEKPVCHARVHICEVDRLPWIIAQLPDPAILRLRDELIRAIEQPFPIDPNPPDPPFVIDPGVIDPAPVLARAANVFGKFDAQLLNPQPLPPKAALKRATHALSLKGFDPQPDPPRAVALELRAALRSQAIGLVRETLVKHIDLVKAYWCGWDWLSPYLTYLHYYDCDELAVIETDAHGRFDTTIWYPCFGDHPDLYFWVEYSIGGAWTTVYRPSIRCHTHWNYVCGSEVNIRLTDPRVPGCGDRPELIGKKIVVKTIGQEVSMGEIYRDSLVPAEKAKEGQVKEGWIHSVKPSPFGGSLEPRVDFGSGLKDANITHYRWSYRTLGSVDENDWLGIEAPVARHYREISLPGDPVVYKSVPVAPDTAVTGYFAIIEPDLPANAEDWEVLDESFDLASTYFDTHALTPGKYELKLELFRNVAGVMTRVDLTTESVEVYQIDDPAPLVEGSYTTTLAQNDRVLKDGLGHVVAYRLVLHVDNRHCFGTIEDVTVNGAAAGPCGFLEYSNLSDTAHIAFRASHPGNFASFDFRVVRVSTTLAEATTGGLVDDALVNGFARAGDTFGKDLSIATLMTSGLVDGETPCTRAAFAEALHVYALATNGYDRLSGYDAPRWWEDPTQVNLKAFAITPA